MGIRKRVGRGNEEKVLIEDEKKRRKNRKKKEKRREKEERKEREEKTELSNSFTPLPSTDTLALPLEIAGIIETPSLKSPDHIPFVHQSPPVRRQARGGTNSSRRKKRNQGG